MKNIFLIIIGLLLTLSSFSQVRDLACSGADANMDTLVDRVNDGLNYLDSRVDILALPETASRTIYVATYPTGNDTTGDGSIGSPYHSALKAIQQIKLILNPDVVINFSFAAGTYTFLWQPIKDIIKKIYFNQGSGLTFNGARSLYSSGFTLAAGSPDAYNYTVTGVTYTANELQKKFLKAGGIYYPISSNTTNTIQSLTGLAAAVEIWQNDVEFVCSDLAFNHLQTVNSSSGNNLSFGIINFTRASGTINFSTGLVSPSFAHCMFTGIFKIQNGCVGYPTFLRVGFYSSSTGNIFSIESNNFSLTNCCIVKTGTRGGIGVAIAADGVVQLLTNPISGLYIGNVTSGIYNYQSQTQFFNTIIDATTTIQIRSNSSRLWLYGTTYILNCTTLMTAPGGIDFNVMVNIATLVGTYTNSITANMLTYGMCNLARGFLVVIPNCDVSGTATLVAGTVTVNTGAVQSASTILLTRKTIGGTPGNISLGTITANTSFVINSDNASDTSVITWQIIK